MAINLIKGQKISLEKEAGSQLHKIFMGLGWDAAKNSGGFFSKLLGGGNDIDLDASCLRFDKNKQLTGLSGLIELTIKPLCNPYNLISRSKLWQFPFPKAAMFRSARKSRALSR